MAIAIDPYSSPDIGPGETIRGAELRRASVVSNPSPAPRSNNMNGDGEKEFPWFFIGLCVVGVLSFCAACWIFYVTAFGG